MEYMAENCYILILIHNSFEREELSLKLKALLIFLQLIIKCNRKSKEVKFSINFDCPNYSVANISSLIGKTNKYCTSMILSIRVIFFCQVNFKKKNISEGEA